MAKQGEGEKYGEEEEAEEARSPGMYIKLVGQYEKGGAGFSLWIG